MANLADKSGDAYSNIVQGTGTNSATFRTPGAVPLDVESVVATIDNTAGGATTATLTIRDASGQVIATKRQGDTIPAGDTGTATFALRLSDEAGGGIDFNLTNIGEWLSVETTGEHFGYGMLFFADVGEIHFFADDAVTGAFRVDAPFIRFDTAGCSFRLLDSGEAFFTGTAGASLTFDTFDIASSPITLTLNAAGSKFEILDSGGNPIFRVNENGDLHGKTGKALVFDL